MTDGLNPMKANDLLKIVADLQERVTALEAANAANPAFEVKTLAETTATDVRVIEDAIENFGTRMKALEAAASTKAREAYLRTIDPMQTYLPPDTPQELAAQLEAASQPAPERDRNIVACWQLPTRSIGPFSEMRYAADQSLIDHLVGDTFRIVEWRLEAHGKSGEPEIVLVLEVTPEAQQEAAAKPVPENRAQAHPARKVEDAEPQPAGETMISLPRTALDDWYMRFALASVTGVMDGSTRKGFNDLLIEIAALIEEHGS